MWQIKLETWNLNLNLKRYRNELELNWIELKMFCCWSLKGYFTQKWNFQTWVSFFCWTQIFWRILITKQLVVAIDFHILFLHGSLPAIFWLPYFSKYHIGDKWWQNFHFWVNYPFHILFIRYSRVEQLSCCPH